MNRWTFFVFLLCSYFIGLAQDPLLEKQVLANGGILQARTNGTRISATVGQNFIGPGRITELIAGIGFWYDIDSTTSFTEEIDLLTTKEIELYQNVPNPFYDDSYAEFYIPRKMSVQFVLIDLNGREMERFIDEILMPGRYRVRLSGKRLSPGTYIYMLEASGQKFTKRCVVLR